MSQCFLVGVTCYLISRTAIGYSRTNRMKIKDSALVLTDKCTKFTSTVLICEINHIKPASIQINACITNPHDTRTPDRGTQLQ